MSPVLALFNSSTPNLRGLLALCMVSCCSVSALADIPARNPKRPVKAAPAKAVTSKLKLGDAPGKNIRIVIPERVMKAAMRQASAKPSRRSVGEAPWRQRSLFAGLALSAAMCSLVLVWRRSATTKTLVVLICVGAAYAGGQWAYADLGGRPVGPVDPPKNPAPQNERIEIAVSKTAKEVELLFPNAGPPKGSFGGPGSFGDPAVKDTPPKK